MIMARFLVLWMIFSLMVLTNQVTAEPSEFEAFKRNVEERLQITEKLLLDTTVDLHNTKKDLQNTQEDLQNTQQDLQNTQQDLQNTKKDLETTKQDLQITKQDLQITKQDLQTTKQELVTSQENLCSTQSKLQLTEERLEIIAEKQQTTQIQQEPADEEMTKSNDAPHKTLKKVMKSQTQGQDVPHKTIKKGMKSQAQDAPHKTRNEVMKSQVKADDTLGGNDLMSDTDEDNNISGSTLGVVAFSAHRNNDIYQGGSVTAPIPFEVIDFVIGPGYDTASSIFTAPVGGLYFFAAGLRDNGAHFQGFIMINGVAQRYLSHMTNSDTVSASGVFQLQAGGTVSVDLRENDYINCLFNGCHFDGYLLYEQL